MNTKVILYICNSCGTKENIPKEVVEYFDEINQSNINEPPCFSCETCGGIMQPIEYTRVYKILIDRKNMAYDYCGSMPFRVLKIKFFKFHCPLKLL